MKLELVKGKEIAYLIAKPLNKVLFHFRLHLPPFVLSSSIYISNFNLVRWNTRAYKSILFQAIKFAFVKELI
jgi:hypothetical protein